ELLAVFGHRPRPRRGRAGGPERLPRQRGAVAGLAGGAGGAMTRSARFETRKRVIADRHRRRLDRQLDFIARHLPFLERPMRVVLRPSLWPLRVPLALVLILGGVFSFLPLLGVWMLPLGLLL